MDLEGNRHLEEAGEEMISDSDITKRPDLLTVAYTSSSACEPILLVMEEVWKARRRLRKSRRSIHICRRIARQG